MGPVRRGRPGWQGHFSKHGWLPVPIGNPGNPGEPSGNPAGPGGQFGQGSGPYGICGRADYTIWYNNYGQSL